MIVDEAARLQPKTWESQVFGTHRDSQLTQEGKADMALPTRRIWLYQWCCGSHPAMDPSLLTPEPMALRPLRADTLLLLMLMLPLLSCSDERPVEEDAEPVVFVDVTEESGVDFRHDVTLHGEYALPEIMGSGVAVLDANGDGNLDLYFVNAGDTKGRGAINRLYLRMEDGRYRDATDESGLGDAGYGMGVAVGDVNGDGHPDLYVGNWGRDALYLGQGDGRFTDATEQAGLTRRDWTTSVALLDYDLDGHLDIYAVHYLVVDTSIKCTGPRGARDYCSPKSYPKAKSDALLRNLGDGRFEDVSREVGLESRASYGLGVVVDDFNADGRPDIYVANDGQPNHLWINHANGPFTEEALPRGAAVNGNGRAEASMGVAVGDVDGDGHDDLFMTHLDRESHTLYRRTGTRGFADTTIASGLFRPSRPATGFGTALSDLDNDGDLDIVVVNGRVTRNTRTDAVQGTLDAYREPNHLFLNDGSGTFQSAPGASPDFCSVSEVSRGLVTADLDGDGDLDLVVTNCGGPARIYENRGGEARAWLAVRVRGPGITRRVIGAQVEVHAGGRTFRRTVTSSASYLSGWDTPLHFGLGDSAEFASIIVNWPGGDRETFAGGPTKQLVTVVRGQGRR